MTETRKATFRRPYIKLTHILSSDSRRKQKTNPSAAERDSVELWTGCLNGEGRQRALPLEAFSPKWNKRPTRVQRALRHRARHNPGTRFVEVKTGSVSKNPQKLLSFQYLYIIHTIHRVHNFIFFSVASDFKLTSDGEKKQNERKKKQPACYLHVTLQLFTLIKQNNNRMPWRGQCVYRQLQNSDKNHIGVKYFQRFL